MVRRDWVKQISERDVGMFDILVFSSTTTQEIVFHMIWTCKWKKKESFWVYILVDVSVVELVTIALVVVVVVENTQEWDSFWSVICGFKKIRLDSQKRERGIYIGRESERLGEMVGTVGLLLLCELKMESYIEIRIQESQGSYEGMVRYAYANN